MTGEVKWFDTKKGYGFIADAEEKEHFVHHSNIIMDGFRHLHKNDIVSYELGAGNDCKEQAVNVKPILTMKMVEDSLKEEGLYIQTMNDGYGVTKYIVINNLDVIQAGENGMSFLEVAAFAGFDTEDLSA